MFFATTVAALVTVGVIKHILSKKKHDSMKNKENSEQSVASHRLTNTETKYYIINALPCISTLTWFKGDYLSVKFHLQKRLRMMLNKNPWLLGRININYLRSSGYLSYMKQRTGDILNNDIDINISEIFDIVPPASSPISRQVPFAELGGVLRDSGLGIQNVPREPMFKVTLLPCSENPRERFALVVQLSHTAGDGATYYKLFHMLCSTEENAIVGLNPERIKDTEQLRIEALGKDEASFLNSMGLGIQFFRGFAKSWIRRVPATYKYGWVDIPKMKEIKEHSAKAAGIPFVSTNDVITSWFMMQTGCPMGLMAINWRNRLEGHTDLHAGNYDSSLFYQRDDFAAPALIRQSLTNYRRVVTRKKAMPCWWKVATSSVVVVTNWNKFWKPIEVEDCEEDVHLPISTAALSNAYSPTLIIFRASSEKVGLAYLQHTDTNLLDFAPFLEKEGV